MGPEGEQGFGSERADEILPSAAEKFALEESPRSSLWLAESGSVSGTESNTSVARKHGKIRPVCFAESSHTGDDGIENAMAQLAPLLLVPRCRLRQPTQLQASS